MILDIYSKWMWQIWLIWQKDERGQKVQKWVDIGDIGEKAGYMHVLLSQLRSVHYNRPKRPNWTVFAVLSSCVQCLFNHDCVCYIYIGVVCAHVLLIVVLSVHSGLLRRLESCEESHLTQSHNDWSAETTLFLTLVALCFSEKMLRFRPPCEIFVDVTCSVFQWSKLLQT